jgi:hypothetical protein
LVWSSSGAGGRFPDRLPGGLKRHGGQASARGYHGYGGGMFHNRRCRTSPGKSGEPNQMNAGAS